MSAFANRQAARAGRGPIATRRGQRGRPRSSGIGGERARPGDRTGASRSEGRRGTALQPDDGLAGNRRHRCRDRSRPTPGEPGTLRGGRYLHPVDLRQARGTETFDLEGALHVGMQMDRHLVVTHGAQGAGWETHLVLLDEGSRCRTPGRQQRYRQSPPSRTGALRRRSCAQS